MANTILRVSHHGKVGFAVLQLLGLMLMLQKIGAVEYQVGGSKGWSVPSDPNAQSFNQWAEAHRFQIGDSLVFKYPAGQDSVLLVHQKDYQNCNTNAPIKDFTDGHTVFKFEKSGPYFFISGNKDNCLKNEKLVLIVLADRTNHQSPPPPNSTEIAPSPPPSDEGSSQPPEASVQINPTPSPISEEPPANAAASTISIISCLGVTGALATSSALLL